MEAEADSCSGIQLEDLKERSHRRLSLSPGVLNLGLTAPPGGPRGIDDRKHATKSSVTKRRDAAPADPPIGCQLSGSRRSNVASDAPLKAQLAPRCRWGAPNNTRNHSSSPATSGWLQPTRSPTPRSVGRIRTVGRGRLCCSLRACKAPRAPGSRWVLL